MRVQTERLANPQEAGSDKCGFNDVQESKHVLFRCPCMEICYFRRKFAEQSHEI